MLGINWEVGETSKPNNMCDRSGKHRPVINGKDKVSNKVVFDKIVPNVTSTRNISGNNSGGDQTNKQYNKNKRKRKYCRPTAEKNKKASAKPPSHASDFGFSLNTMVSEDSYIVPPTVGRIYLEPVSFGMPNKRCEYCNAVLWIEEKISESSKKHPKFNICCQEGFVKLPQLKDPPPFLRHLLWSNDGSRKSKFKENIRAYNSIFAFTSTGGLVDTKINQGRVPYVYRLSGQNYHKIGSLIPPDGQNPKFAQLYIFDTANEVSNRMSAVNNVKQNPTLDEDIVEGLLHMLDEHSCLAKVFRLARDRFSLNVN